ncbi:MAG: hypothetical protein AAGI12_13960 [Pseudomonadota bacterium]
MLYRRFFLVTLFAAVLGLLTSNLLNAAAQRDHHLTGGVSLKAQTLTLTHRG